MSDGHRLEQSISRTSVVWLLVAQVMVLLPLRDVLPIPLFVIALFCFIWRLALWYGRLFWPPLWLRSALIALSLGTVAVSFQPLWTLESMVSVLGGAYSLKLLEMRQRRDALVVVYIGFFVVTTSALFSQSLLQAGYLVLCLVILIAAQQGLYRRNELLPVKNSLKYGLVLVLQAAPLTVVLFVLVPRLDPLWSVPQPDYSATTGVSDRMAPGDIARLSQSDELAFRAVFEGSLPMAQERYWRMVVLDQFDGKSWYQSSTADLVSKGVAVTEWQQDQRQPVEWWSSQPDGYRYEVLLEATGNPWLVTLGPATRNLKNYLLMRTLRLEAGSKLYERQVYSFSSSTFSSSTFSGKESGLSTVLPDWLRRHNLQLPRGNPQTRRMARRWMLSVKGQPQQLAERILQYFKEQNFAYTLSPPLMAGESIDRFLFSARQGFCAHYAGAFVFMMRAAGVPARVVSGYQGGELKPEQNMIQVRQFDAHAWAEIWVSGKGWVRYDPTNAIAPERISGGLQSALGLGGGFLDEQPLSLFHFRNVTLLNQFRLFYENLEYRWQRTVIDYQREQQQALLKGLLGGGYPQWQQTGLLVSVIFMVLLVSSLMLLYHRDSKDELTRLYSQFLGRLQRSGVQIKAGEGEWSLAKRIEAEHPELSEAVWAFVKEYIQCRYASKEPVESGYINELKNKLKSL
ncbi:hypothetical protein GZ77_02375 [Endozoicomonas montiporae]|uniref:Transglutaminase-like domain-containing protein n=2 Tax=Endozoicomonas montiporae TaxID=1027273 RepID=A0A081NAM9_9GAMM|nr:DUF3488 and transglutaminase-like domain-containing protein [Endozoicomonas montiporae]AMO56816.1 transglutaminase [Endozoicomonas montiporae CL-33]KEQ15502.1 hypothetical protein GZ77_02375 [Endozoicomonas montiporae]